MAALKLTPGRLPVGHLDGRPVQSSPELFRVLQALQERTGGLGGVVTAGTIASTPSGGLSATNVQAALNELDADKEAAGTAAAALAAHLADADPHPQYLTATEGAAAYQPLDADLTAWAEVTRAAGFDAFAAAPSSANLRGLLTDETGSGAAVFATSPTISAPLLTGTVYTAQPTPTSKAAAATLTIAELLTGIVQYTGAVANLTLPTGTAIDGGVLASLPVDQSFDFSVIVTGAGAATLLTAAGLTLVGSMVVAAGSSGRFRVRKTAANAYSVYRIA